MHKIVKIVLIVLGLIGAILWFNLPGREVPETEAIKSGSMNFMFIITYILLAIAVLATVIFGLKNLLASPGSLKKTLFGIGGLLVVVLISWALASGTDISIDEMATKGIETSESTIRKIGMGLNVFFILVVVAVLAMLLPGLKKMFSK